MEQHLSQEELVAYLEEQSTTERGTHIRRHLEACSTCRKKLDGTEKLLRKLRMGLGLDQKEKEPTPEFVQRVKKAIRQASGTNSLPKEEP